MSSDGMAATDRQRVELLLPGFLLIDAARSGALDDAELAKEAEALLLASSVQVVADVSQPAREKLLRRASRLFQEVVGPHKKGSTTAMLALVGFFFLDELSSSGYLVVGEESPLSRAIELMLPDLEAAAQSSPTEDRARELARSLIQECRARGYYPPI